VATLIANKIRDSMVLSDNFLPSPLPTNTATLAGAKHSNYHQLHFLVEPCEVYGRVTTSGPNEIKFALLIWQIILVVSVSMSTLVKFESTSKN